MGKGPLDTPRGIPIHPDQRRAMLTARKWETGRLVEVRPIAMGEALPNGAGPATETAWLVRLPGESAAEVISDARFRHEFNPRASGLWEHRAPVLARPDPVAHDLVVVEERGKQRLITAAEFAATYRLHDAFARRDAFRSIVFETPRLLAVLDRHPIQGARAWPHVLIMTAPHLPHHDGWIEVANQPDLLMELAVARAVVARWFATFGAVPLFHGNDSAAGGWVRNPKQSVQHVHMHAAALADAAHPAPGEGGIRAVVQSPWAQLSPTVTGFDDPRLPGIIAAMNSGGAYCHAQVGCDGDLHVMSPVGAAIEAFDEAVKDAWNLTIGPNSALGGFVTVLRHRPRPLPDTGPESLASAWELVATPAIQAALRDPEGPEGRRLVNSFPPRTL